MEKRLPGANNLWALVQPRLRERRAMQGGWDGQPKRSQKALSRSEFDRSLILEFHHYGLEWAVAEILLPVLCGATPTHLAGFVLRGLGLAIGCGHGAVLVGQAYHYSVKEMLVQWHFLMSGDLHPHHANLAVFELDPVVVGIDSHRVERGIHLRGCTAGFLQLHLND